MAFENPFQAEGEWLKGNLHTHTTLSDGQQTPHERVAAYEARGYDFLALTDHDVLAATEAIWPRGIVLIRGIELVGDNAVGGPPYHIVGLGLPRTFDLPGSRNAQALIDAIRAAGGQAVVAHPYWCGQTLRDLEVLTGYLGVEVFNTTCHRTIGKGTSSVQWTELLTQGKRVFGLAVDDTHRATRDAFQGWVMVKAAERSAKGVMDALAAGRFYATCGPTIEAMSVTGTRVWVRTSPVAHFSFIAAGSSGGHVFCEDGSPVTEAEYAIRSGEAFVRVECTDAAGRTAWSNPIFLR